MTAVARPRQVGYKLMKANRNSPKLLPIDLKKTKSQDVISGNSDFHVRQDSVQRLFHWDARQKLGAGAFAHVLRATCAAGIPTNCEVPWGLGHLEPGKEYAVKVLPSDFLQKGSKHHKNLVHEVAILHHINHPGCIKLYDVFEDVAQDSVVLVLEFVGGGELLKMLQDHVQQGGCLTEAEARNIVSQLLEVLAYLQDHQIVHRDVKPENIIINPDTLQVKIIDFGFAKFFGHQAPRGMEDMVVASPLVMTPIGTVRYMPPEVLNVITPHQDHLLRAREQVQKLDIFSLGVVAYLILGGAHPFRCRSFADLPELIEEGPSFDGPHFTTISSRAKDFCLRLMHYNAEERPTAKEALQHPWFQCPISIQPNKIVIQETQSTGVLMDWLRDQSQLEHADETLSPSVRGRPAAVKTSPITWSRGWQASPTAKDGNPEIPALQVLAVKSHENWADMSCEFDDFCHGSTPSLGLPTPLALTPAAQAFPTSPPPAGMFGGTSQTANWADMSIEDDSFWATAGLREP
eukprot:GGOE01009543.1.p1 GENE.GGOE01009543.1~~GGOE01009543.1.p1  ORF type:complete len:534 (+),score=151.21 GGOE01009543.1:50-1603(+)